MALRHLTLAAVFAATTLLATTAHAGGARIVIDSGHGGYDGHVDRYRPGYNRYHGDFRYYHDGRRDYRPPRAHRPRHNRWRAPERRHGYGGYGKYRDGSYYGKRRHYGRSHGSRPSYGYYGRSKPDYGYYSRSRGSSSRFGARARIVID